MVWFSTACKITEWTILTAKDAARNRGIVLCSCRMMCHRPLPLWQSPARRKGIERGMCKRGNFTRRLLGLWFMCSRRRRLIIKYRDDETVSHSSFAFFCSLISLDFEIGGYLCFLRGAAKEAVLSTTVAFWSSWFSGYSYVYKRRQSSLK